MAGKILLGDSQGDTLQLLGEFALRLTGGTSASAPEGYPRLYVGALPVEFPLELSLPPHTHTIGTIIRSPESAQVYADIPEIPERVVQLFDEMLFAKGWRRMPEGYSRGGFQAGPIEEFDSAHYCKSDTGPALHLIIKVSTEALTEITVSFQVETHGLCNPEAQRRMRGMYGPGSMVPPLLAPAGTWKSGGGASGGPDDWYTSAVLETDMTLDHVMEHYAKQLVASGWTLRGTVEGGISRVTYWDLVDSEQSPYIGILDVKKLETRPQLRYLHLILNKIDEPGGRV